MPAFRYALERWPADPYHIVVYRGEGPKGAALELLEKSGAERDGAANYVLKTIDVTQPEGKELAERRGITAFPWVEIYYPLQSQVRTPVWSGPLTAERARKILDSPARSRLARDLVAGDVAVWVLLRSGQEEKDRRAKGLLVTNLRRASETLRIPETGADINGNPIAVTEFKTYPVRFGLLEIARDDPEEELLVSALLKSEPDLEEYREPLAFPVFGRGRALYGLAGAGIQEKTIMEACSSLVGWCTCEIKASSPGTDLLVAADWSRPFGGRMVKDPELPLTGVGGFLRDRKPAETAAAQPVPAPEPALCKLPRRDARTVAEAHPPGGAILRNVLSLAAAAGVVLLVLSVFLTVKAKQR